MLSTQKIVLLSVIGVLFFTWLTWYIVTYLHIQRVSVLQVASEALSCPEEQIKRGPSYQFNDGPSEIPVEGCGKKTKILCTDYASTHHLIDQYFSFDIQCREE